MFDSSPCLEAHFGDLKSNVVLHPTYPVRITCVLFCSPKVLPHIRLALISPSYLQDVMESQDVVKESQACQRIISEAREAPPRWSTGTCLTHAACN